MTANLPPELWTEICVRLQVRTLHTLKCVSKFFLSLIQNPNFIHLHLARHTFESEGSHLLFLERPAEPDSDNDWQFSVRCSDTFMTTLTFNASTDKDCRFEVEGYVNGLVLIRKYGSNEMILWNPSIRKYVIIPPYPSSHLRFAEVGFGYDLVMDDYKVVVILYSEDQSCGLFEVYQVSTGNWRSIGVDGISNEWYLFQKIYFDGAIHWLGSYADPGGYYISHVISLDLSSEVISYTELPVDEDDDGPVNPRLIFPLVFNRSLAVFDISFDMSCLWLMEERGWVKLYAVKLPPALLDLVNEEFNVISNLVCSGNGKLLFNRGSGLLSYDLETQELRTHSYDGDCATYIGIYAESLFGMDGFFVRPH